MRKISADVVFPVVTPPIENGVVIVDDDGKILSIGERKDFDDTSLEIYNGIICPGFINAHCHLELSYMKGKIQEGKGLVTFITDLVAFRKGFGLTLENEDRLGIIYDSIRMAEEEMRKNGICGVGDISNEDHSFLFKSRSEIRSHTFIECFGYYPQKANTYLEQSVALFLKARDLQLDASITPHASYSVTPELFSLLFSFSEHHLPLFSFHNQESDAENNFFRNGEGPFQKLFDHFGFPLSIFSPTGKNSIESVISYFPARYKTLFVHNTFSNADDIGMVTSQLPEAFFCFCPKANLYIENKLPDFSLFKKFNNRICLGTDSLASNTALSILEEIKTIQQHDPSIGTAELIQWATLNGAAFFGWNDQFGSIEAGKSPGLNLLTDILPGTKLSEHSTVQKLI
jgi:cytosine/adenosine deaminase-related metal-dependent hydrolase